MPEDIEALLKQSAAAVQYAQDVRSHHRKRTKRGHPQREADLEIALERLRSAMEPVRSMIGRMQFEVPSKTKAARYERVRAASQNLQRERRKLWKMQDRSN